MNNFTVIYKILFALEKAMDVPEFDVSLISPENLGITQERWNKCIEMLSDNGYVKGVEVKKTIVGTFVKYDDMKITLKGLEYLSENSIMKKVCNALKGVIDVIT